MEIIGSKNNINRAGSHRISKIAPTMVKLYTFMTCPSHQYPDTVMLKIRTILPMLEFLNAVECVTIPKTRFDYY